MLDEKTIEELIKHGNKSSKRDKQARQIVILLNLIEKRISEIKNIAMQYEDEFWELPNYFTDDKKIHVKDLWNTDSDLESINHIAKILLKHGHENEAEEYAALYYEHKKLKQRENEFIAKHRFDPRHVIKRFVDGKYDEFIESTRRNIDPDSHYLVTKIRRINLNDKATVKLTAEGIEIAKQDKTLNINNENEVTTHLWNILHCFGQHCFIGTQLIFEKNEIIVQKDELIELEIKGAK